MNRLGQSFGEIIADCFEKGHRDLEIHVWSMGACLAVDVKVPQEKTMYTFYVQPDGIKPYSATPMENKE